MNVMLVDQAASGAIAVQSWSAPQIGASSSAARRMPQDLMGEERRVWQEAESAGRAAGLAAAKGEIDARLRKLDEAARGLQVAMQALARPLSQLDDQVHEQIVLLATSLARALVRRELRTDPSQVIGIVRDTVSLLPASARGVRVLLHPQDAALVRERLSSAGPDAAWTIGDDPVLARGDCRVHTEYAQIDARLETRLNEALSLLLGDERTQPRAEVPD